VIRSGVVNAATAATVDGKSISHSAIVPVQVSPTIPTNVQVKLDPLSGCGACSASSGCGVQLLPISETPLIIDCQLPAGATVSVGDRVQVQLAEPGSDWLRVVLLAYGSPTIGMITGALVGYWSAVALHVPQFAESVSLAGFSAGLAGGLIAWFRAEKSVYMRHDNVNRLQPHKVIIER